MKRLISTLIAVAGVCGVVNAATTVEILLSTNGVDFSSVIQPFGGGIGLQTVQVLVSVSTTNPNAIGLGSMIFQPTVSNWTSTDALVPFTAAFGSNTSTPSGAVADASGQYGRITPWAAVSISSAQRLFGHFHQNGSGGAPPDGFLRIAQAQVTSWIGGTANTSGGSGVNIKQLSNIGRTASDPAFNGNVTSVHVFRYAVQLDTNAIRGGSGLLGVRFDAPAAGFGNLNTTTGQREVYWYADMNEASGSIREVPTVIPGLIAPSPGAIAVIGFGMIGVARRRRS